MKSIPMIPFFTPEVQTAFFGNLKAVLYVVMPMILIVLATMYGGIFLKTMVATFRKITSQDDDEYGENEYNEKY